MSAIKKNKWPKSKQAAKVIPMRIVYSKSRNENEKFIHGMWMTLYSTFWNNRQFSPSETSELKKLIADYFENGKNQKRNFKDLAERICLAKRYVNRKKGRYISKPIDYLNINYRNGLQGTASWLKEVKEQRKSAPHYNEGITTFATALLSYIESPSASVYYKFRTKLIAQKQYDLLQIFQNTILNLQFLN